MTLSASALGVRLDTRTAGDLVTDAIALLRQRMPQLVLRNASVEVVLMEAMALTVEGVISGADAILGEAVETILAGLYGVPRLAGASAVGEVRLDFAAPTTTVVPAGSVFVLRGDLIDLVVTADATITSATTATVPVATALPSAPANGLGADSPLDVLVDIPNLIGATLVGPLSGGMDSESDDEYKARASMRLDRVTSGLVTLRHFAAYTIEDGRAVTARTVGAWAGVNPATMGTDAGHVSVVCYGRGGQVPDTDRADLAAAMSELTVAGVSVHVVPAEIVPVPVTVTVHAASGWSTSDVQANVTDVLTGWLDPAAWEWDEPVRVTTAIALIGGLTSVDYVASLSAPAADVVLKPHQLPAVGKLTITVT